MLHKQFYHNRRSVFSTLPVFRFSLICSFFILFLAGYSIAASCSWTQGGTFGIGSNKYYRNTVSFSGFPSGWKTIRCSRTGADCVATTQSSPENCNTKIGYATSCSVEHWQTGKITCSGSGGGSSGGGNSVCQSCFNNNACASNSCQMDFDQFNRFCFPSGKCANCYNGGTSGIYNNGYELCGGGGAWYKSCISGVWGPQVWSPDTTSDYCNAGGGAQSGYDRAATCISGYSGGFSNPGCVSCKPYMAASVTSCRTTCTLDAHCWPAYHCDAPYCYADLSNCGVCDEDSDCISNNCDNDFNSGTSYCHATSSKCVDCPGHNEYDNGYELCSGNSWYRTCNNGRWGITVNNPDLVNDYCDAGGGAQSGYDLAASCSSGLSGGFSDPSCISCMPYMAASTSSCKNSCNGNSDCWPGYCCDSSSQCSLSCDDDCGLRGYDGKEIIRFACEPAGTLKSPFRIQNGGVTYGIVLVDTNNAKASGFRVQTASGTKALKKI